MYLASKELYLRALSRDVLCLSERYIDTVANLMSLAPIYIGQKCYEEAEKPFQRAFEAIVTQFGPEHPESMRVRIFLDGARR